MRTRFHPWLLLLALCSVCVGAIALVVVLRYRSVSTTTGLIRHLPAEDALVLYIDFASLRKAGLIDLLNAAETAQEPEYQKFVAQSGFDYRQDLDAALVSFRKDAVFMLVRGRFDWKVLSTYVQAQGGSCHNAFCRVSGSTPERSISFCPLRPDVLALAVSKDDWAATELMRKRSGLPGFSIPPQPVWLLIPPGRLTQLESLPAGTRQFARAIAGAERILLSIGQQGDHFEALLDITSGSSADASLMLTHLDGITSFLRKMVTEGNRQPNPRDLSGVLTAGSFERQDRRVLGRWPIQRAFLEALASGSL